ncbi:hypothetical protein BD408DRAFT_453809 [Parasitella parasitica]|nr:hypothetical protein BD408DRAFT_453809 [Parasitella parasitica]
MTESKDKTFQTPILVAHWFHAIDKPIVDPIAIRKAKRNKTFTSLKNSSISPDSTSSNNNPKNWVPFSKRDNTELEIAFENGTKVVSVNEDHLFQVDIHKREISPVYWEGPIFEVRRATWFMQADSKWLPCEENMAKQVEEGYRKHEPIKSEPEETAATMGDKERDIGQVEKAKEAPKKQAAEIKVDEGQKEYLLGPYLGQYVVYSSPTQAWLL